MRFEKVATPFTAVIVIVPDSVPPLGPEPSAIVIEPLKLVETLPDASRAVTWTAGEIALPAVALLGCTVNASCVAGGATQVTWNETDALPPAGTVALCELPPLTAQFAATPESVTVWLPEERLLND
jgi:hypothetical protein